MDRWCGRGLGVVPFYFHFAGNQGYGDAIVGVDGIDVKGSAQYGRDNIRRVYLEGAVGVLADFQKSLSFQKDLPERMPIKIFAVPYTAIRIEMSQRAIGKGNCTLFTF